MIELAHIDGAEQSEHELVVHLLDVAELALAFARDARPDDPLFQRLAYWAGLLHDLGKYRVEFQDYLHGRRAKGQETQHAVFGAAWAWERLSKAVAFAINGHHAGLHDFFNCSEKVGSEQLKPLPEAERLIDRLRDALHSRGVELPELVGEIFERRRGRVRPVELHREFVVRMIFSCLVDADYLDTERFMRGTARPRMALGPERASSLFEHVHQRVEDLNRGSDESPIRDIRNALYRSSLRQAESPPGFFSLTAPTGGGKTLTSLAFALKHAETNHLRRVIVVIPFLTIIEQNARIYREVLGEEVVVEHHSSAVPGVSEADESESGPQVAAKQATENWDAPVIVTTAVQFLESLLARSPSKCRKLHNVARSVVIFDEVQTLAHHLLEPILSVLRELREHYGVSFLFCSATQPQFSRSRELPSGFEPGECREIAPEPGRVFGVLQRARFELPFLDEAPWDWETLVSRIASEPRVLVVVNLRRQAAELFRRLNARGVEGLDHLSSTMCPAHRSDTLGRKDRPVEGTIYHALGTDRPCRVISTQVVEAGVDIDFPVVFRALGPLDAIIQAAGRCNREGRLPPEPDGRPGGRVVVFESAEARNTPPDFYEFATGQARIVLTRLGDDTSKLATDPAVFASYHETLIAWKSTDAADIQDDRKQLDFEKVAQKFRVIDQGGQTIVVPYDGTAERLIAAVSAKGFATVEERRTLQRYTVNLYPADVRALGSAVEPLIAGDDAVMRYRGHYDPALGMPLGELPPDTFALF